MYFPRELLVASDDRVAGWSRSLIELGVLCVILLIVGNMVLPWIPVRARCSSLLSRASCSAWRWCSSVCNVYFRDVQHLVGIVLQVLFYATPIVYPITLVPERTRRARRRACPLLRSTS